MAFDTQRLLFTSSSVVFVVWNLSIKSALDQRRRLTSGSGQKVLLRQRQRDVRPNELHPRHRPRRV
jgi:hypothetical protein